MRRPVSSARLLATALTFGTGSALTATAALLPHQWHRLPLWWHGTFLLVVVGCLVAFSQAALGLRSPVGPARVMVATVAVAMALLPLVASGSFTQGESPWVAIFMPTSLVACGLTFRRWPSTLALGTGMVLLDAAVRASDVFSVSTLEVVGQAVYDLTLLLVALGILLALTFTERELGTQAAVAADSYLRARTIEELSRHHAQWDALVHDEVLATLESAARQASAHEVRRAAQGTAARLRAGPVAQTPGSSSTSLRDGMLEVVLDVNPAARTRFVPPTPDACEVSAEVTQALLTATAEALRNATVHAYPPGTPGPVLVELQHTAAGVRVAVRDHGRGFRRERVPRTSFGIMISIEERMATVGGRGVVSSTPGAGTQVELTWTHGSGR